MRMLTFLLKKDYFIVTFTLAGMRVRATPPTMKVFAKTFTPTPFFTSRGQRMLLSDERLKQQAEKASRTLASAGMNAAAFHELQVNH